jgi:1,4-alpha-glucan branching enzyme
MRWLGYALFTTFALFAGAACAARLTPAQPVVTAAGVRFSFAHPTARSVTLAGSFNQWSIASNPLAPVKTAGVWTAVVPLPPGEHLFMYVVDGTEWVTPPLAEDYVDDGFGSRNGVVVVRPQVR